MDKKIVIILLIGLIACLFVPLVSASYVSPGGQQLTADYQTTGVSATHPSVTSSRSAVGIAFTANATAYLYESHFYLYRVGAADGVLVSKLYAIQGGTVGVNAYPTDTVLATSAPVAMDTLSGDETDIQFTFDGTVQLTSAATYFIDVEVSEASTNPSSNFVRYWSEALSPNFNIANFRNSNWEASTSDITFYLVGDTEAGTPSPTATPSSPATTPNDGGMTALTNALLPILVPLLIVLIPAFLGLKFIGAWGFMAGLNVGVIIAYVILANTVYAFPLWGVVFIGIVDVLLVMKARG